MNRPDILSTHAVGLLTVSRFRTRFGEVTWIVSDDRLVGHGGIYQGDRDGAIKLLRRLMR